MIRKASTFILPVFALALGVTLASCGSDGTLKNPFVKEKPFVSTPVPADFAIVIDENHDTFYARQHIQQIITPADAMSRTRYTTYRDLNNVPSNDFTQESPLSPVQLQDMWDAVVRHDLLQKGRPFINWLSEADVYKQDSYTLQVRANGQVQSYYATNGFSGQARPLMLLVEAVRLPITQDSKTKVLGGRPTAPATEPASPPATDPASPPATSPAM